MRVNEKETKGGLRRENKRWRIYTHLYSEVGRGRHKGKRRERTHKDSSGDSKLQALSHSVSGTAVVRVLTPFIPPFETLISSLTTVPGSHWGAGHYPSGLTKCKNKTRMSPSIQRNFSFPDPMASSLRLDIYIFVFLEAFPNNFLSSLQVPLPGTSSPAASQAGFCSHTSSPTSMANSFLKPSPSLVLITFNLLLDLKLLEDCNNADLIHSFIPHS